MTNTRKAKKAFDEAAAAFVREDYLQGIQLFSKAIHFDPTMEVAYISRGVLHLKCDRWRNAISDFNKAIELDTAYARAYNFRGLAYKKLGNTARAFRDLDRALEIDPDLTDAYHSRSCLIEKDCREDLLQNDLGMIHHLATLRVNQFLEPEALHGINF